MHSIDAHYSFKKLNILCASEGECSNFGSHHSATVTCPPIRHLSDRFSFFRAQVTGLWGQGHPRQARLEERQPLGRDRGRSGDP